MKQVITGLQGAGLDIYFHGKIIAGMLTPDRSAFADSYTCLFKTTGDNLFTVYAISVGSEADKVGANPDAVGALSARLIEEAVADAINSAKTN